MSLEDSESASDPFIDNLDAMHPEDWLVSPWHEIPPEDRLTREETHLLRDILIRRNPAALPRLESIGKVVLKPSERESVRNPVLDEYLEFGLRDDEEPNAYGNQLGDLMGKLGRI